MLALAVSSFVTLYLMTSFGYFFTKLAKLPASFTEKTLVGLVVSNTVVTIISLFLPINLSVLAALLLCSTAMSYFAREDLRSLFSSLASQKKALLYSAPFIAIAFVICLGSPGRVYDTGLYHLQTIKWIEEYAVVPGLANLHGRFGFNPNIFTFFACTSLFEVFKQELFSVNFTIYAILVLHFVHKILALYKEQGVGNMLLFNVIIFINIVFTSSYLASPSPNVILVLLPLFILASVSKPSEQDATTGVKKYLPVMMLCVYVLTVKLATIPLLILVFFLILRHRTETRSLLFLLVVSAVIVLPWLARNVILTGWLLYPFPSLDLFNFDWKVPVLDVVREKSWVTGYARNPGDPDLLARARMSLSQWFPLWWQHLGFDHKTLLLASLASPLLAVVGVAAKKMKIGYCTGAIIFTSFFGVLFWFTLAPAVAFGKPFILVAAISPLLYFSFSFTRHSVRGLKTIKFLYAVVIILFACNAKNVTRFDLHRIAYAPQPIQKPNDVNFSLFDANGVSLYVPTSGDRCYDQKLPCTPYPDKTLALRNATLQSGFKHLGGATKSL
jgi:hypothetical protein